MPLIGLGLALVWIAAGMLTWRAGAVRARFGAASRSRRILFSSVFFLLSAAVLVGGLMALAATGPLEGWRWLGVAAIGLAFVELQVLAALVMVGLVQEGVTSSSAGPSTKVELGSEREKCD